MKSVSEILAEYPGMESEQVALSLEKEQRWSDAARVWNVLGSTNNAVPCFAISKTVILKKYWNDNKVYLNHYAQEAEVFRGWFDWEVALFKEKLELWQQQEENP